MIPNLPQVSRIGWLLLGLWLVIQPAAGAQSASVSLKSLQVELWPEYDQPETLVIYRAELNPATSLPAQLTFPLPGYLEKVFVVAIEQNGVLVEVKPETYELKREGDTLTLNFSTPSPKVQFEYYDPAILTRQDQQRQLKFNFTAPYATDKAAFHVQEPVQSEKFFLNPAPSSTFTGEDGLKYYKVEVAGLAAGEKFTLTAGYTRPTDDLSTQSLKPTNTEHAADLNVITDTSTPNSTPTLGYILMGLGAVILLGMGGYWWRAKRVKTEAPSRRPPSAKERTEGPPPVRAATQAPTSTSANLSGSFCYHCGAALRPNTSFCHVCGAEQRK